MVWILLIGAVIAVINVVLTYNELIPFFVALKQLNAYTKAFPTLSNRTAYVFRFLRITPKLTPLILDGTIAIAAGALGLNGGVYGALIGLTLGFTASLLVKFHRHFIAPRLKVNTESWKVA